MSPSQSSILEPGSHRKRSAGLTTDSREVGLDTMVHRYNRQDMTVIVNGQPVSVNAPATVAQVLEQLQLPHLRVAVEVNQTVVPRSQWAAHPVNDGDRLEVVQFVGGGC